MILIMKMVWEPAWFSVLIMNLIGNQPGFGSDNENGFEAIASFDSDNEIGLVVSWWF